MYYEDDIEIFISALREYMEKTRRLKPSTVAAYIRRIRQLLENGHTVSSLCEGIDHLVEAHGRGGDKFREEDHGTLCAALNCVRRMVKGELIDSLFISLMQGSSVAWVRKSSHIVGYEIKGERISLRMNDSKKPVVKKISPKNVASLLSILGYAAHRGLLSEEPVACLWPSWSSFLPDAPGVDLYEYRFGDTSGSSRGALFTEGSKKECLALERQYKDLIRKIIAPYSM